jgi:hypothetical protein
MALPTSSASWSTAPSAGDRNLQKVPTPRLEPSNHLSNGPLECEQGPVQGRPPTLTTTSPPATPGHARVAELDAAARAGSGPVADRKDSSGTRAPDHESGVLLSSLMAPDLIDQDRLMTAPLVLGAGRRRLAGGSQAWLRLVDTSTKSTGC